MITKTKLRTSAEREPSLDMSSMIDISFLLLVFFLITSTLDPKEADLGMSLPVPGIVPGLIQPIDYLPITIQPDGSVMVDATILDTDLNRRELPLLYDKLKQYKDAADLLSSETLIIVRADDEVRGQRFVDVLNTLAKAGIKDVTFAE